MSAYIGQTVKITSSRFKNGEKVNVIKRFAIPGRWCTVVDSVSGRVYKVMKKGKSLMQIPIQSLSTVHSKSYDFPFKHDIFKYHLSDDELDQIELKLGSGEVFEFPEDAVVATPNKRKREKKQKDKEDENQ